MLQKNINNNINKKSNNGQITIGYISIVSIDHVAIRMLEGIYDAVDNFNVNLISMNAGFNNGKFTDDIKDIIVETYKLLINKEIDGLLVWTGPLGGYINVEEVRDILSNFKDIPIVCMSKPYDEHYLVLSENYESVKTLIVHLIKVHNRKKIVFLRGTIGHYYAEERFRAYIDTMKEFDITIDERLISNDTSFRTDKAVNFLREIIEVEKLIPGKDFNAIFCSSDIFVEGVVNELRKYGARVPEDVSIISFNNNISESIFAPVTTVDPVFYNLCFRSVEVLIRIIKGLHVDEISYVPSQVIIRQSCGCGILENDNSYDKDKIMHNKNLLDNILVRMLNIRDSLKKEFYDLIDDMNTDMDKELVDELISIVYGQVKRRSFNSYNISPQSCISKIYTYKNSFYIINQILCRIKFLLYTYTDDEFILNEIEIIFSGWFNLIYNASKDIRWTLSYEDISHFSDKIADITLAKSIDTLCDLIEKDLPSYQIPGCYLILFDEFDNRKLIMSIVDNKRQIINEKDNEIDNDTLVPRSFYKSEKRNTLILKALFHESKLKGYILFYKRPENISNTSKGDSIYEMLKTSINDGLSTSIITNQKESLMNSLESSNQKHEEVIEEIKKTNAHLIETEKMAAIGQLVSGVAHEVNTPIGVSLTAVTLLEQKLNEFTYIFNGNGVKKAELFRFLDTFKEASSILLLNLKRAADIINNFKNVASDQEDKEKKLFNVKEYIDQILLSLAPKLKKTNHQIDIICDEELNIFSYAGLFYQILANLIINSLVHAFDRNKDGIITISVEKKENDIIIIYKDNGKGIKYEYLSKIFDPFFTTNRTKGGTGLGLNIIYNIVTQSLKGFIKCESEVGIGTKFIIKFPYINI